MTLNTFSIERAKPAEKAYKLADGGGLFLLIQPSGQQTLATSVPLSRQRANPLDWRVSGRRARRVDGRPS